LWLLFIFLEWSFFDASYLGLYHGLFRTMRGMKMLRDPDV